MTPQQAPWTAGPWVRRGNLIISNDARCTIVAEVTGSPSSLVSQADGDLIAAAPQMAEALQELRRHLEYQANQDGGDYGQALGPIMQRVEAALAAAGAVR